MIPLCGYQPAVPSGNRADLLWSINGKASLKEPVAVHFAASVTQRRGGYE